MFRVAQKVLEIASIHKAARRLNPSELEALLIGGADPNLSNSFGNTPLHIVLNNEFQGHLGEHNVTDCVQILLKYNADHRIKGRYNLTPLELAIKNKLHRSIKLLLDTGARCVGSLVAEMPQVVQDRLDNGISTEKDTDGSDWIVLDWRPVLGYNEHLHNKEKSEISVSFPSESKFLYEVLTSDVKDSSIKEGIINHPLVMAYLFLKNSRIPKYFYLTQLFEVIYLVLMAVFIYFLYFDRCPIPKVVSTEETEYSTIASSIVEEKCDIDLSTVIQCYVILLFTLAFGLRDLFLLKRVGLLHLAEWRDWVWRLSLLVNLPVLWPAVYPTDDYTLSYNYPFCSVAILLLSLHALIQMETFQLLSVYVEILMTSMITVVKLLLMFSPVYLGFYMGFNLMFSDVTRVFTYLGMTVDAGSDNFEAIGDKAKENSFMFELISKGYVLAFIIVMCIGFMNYVLAMSIDDVQRLKKDAKISRAVRHIRNLLQVDQRSRSYRLVKDPTSTESYSYKYKPDADDQELPDNISLEIVMVLKRKRDSNIAEV